MSRTRLSLYYLISYLAFAGLALLLALFIYSGDPLFIVLMLVVGLGVALTAVAYWLDRRAGGLPQRAAA
jgi:hypothetical protein